MRNDAIDDESLMRMFRQYDDVNELVRWSVLLGGERALRLLLREQNKPSAQDIIRLLRTAYTCSTVGVIDLLLSAGGSADAAHDGTPAWHLAAENGNESVMAKVMIADGFNVNAADSNGVSLAHRAAHAGNEKVMAMLIATGADVTVRDAYGNTLCHFAAKNYNAKVMALLIPLCDVNAANVAGETPCMWAVEEGNRRALALLIGAGANVNDVDNHGQTVGERAVRRSASSLSPWFTSAPALIKTPIASVEFS